MKLIICTDENNGMLFNNRRQSRDSVLCQYVLDLAAGAPLAMTEYSAKIFPESENIVVCDNVFKSNGFCFAEEAVPSLAGVEELYWFNWNRSYPADVVFNH
ncbi:MAG: ribonuclease Z, partial [Clostridia bacterium]|nr:ribonuclease Z [Clostridia bacterium]